MLHSDFPLYRGTPIVASKNVMYSKTATGLMQTSHTYIMSKSLSSESEHGILEGGVKLTRIIQLVIFPYGAPLVILNLFWQMSF